jgi:hypothetical protein
MCLFFSIEEKVSTISRQLRILENEKQAFLSDQELWNSRNHNLEAEKRELHILVDKRVKENDRLNGIIFMNTHYK